MEGRQPGASTYSRAVSSVFPSWRRREEPRWFWALELLLLTPPLPADQDQAPQQVPHWWRKACKRMDCFCRPLRLDPSSPRLHSVCQCPHEPCLSAAILSAPFLTVSTTSYLENHSCISCLSQSQMLCSHLTQLPPALNCSPLVFTGNGDELFVIFKACLIPSLPYSQ